MPGFFYELVYLLELARLGYHRRVRLLSLTQEEPYSSNSTLYKAQKNAWKSSKTGTFIA